MAEDIKPPGSLAYIEGMSVTCVSCYYKIKNKHGDKYDAWFKNTLAINCPYVFFSNKEGIEYIKQFRGTYPTYYVELNMEDFRTYKYKNKILTHPIHCPSAELKMVWDEKIYLIQRASTLNPFGSDWFQWIDAGICTYRDAYPPQTPFPDVRKLAQLPTDKFIYSSSQPYKRALVTMTNYYHHISGTSYILHKSIIDRFVELYGVYLEQLIDKDNKWTDQDILTHIYKDNPDMFFRLCDGYGEVTRFLM